MAQSFQKIRDVVFQLVFSQSFDFPQELSLIIRQNMIPKSLARLAQERANAIWNKREELDQKIVSKVKNYDLDRISKVEKSVLRLGLYELMYSDTPPKVVISEAIRLTKKYATAEGAHFVNALLDAICKELLDDRSAETNSTV